MKDESKKPELKLDPSAFLKQQIALFKDFSDERLQQLVKGSRVASFEANEAIAHSGTEAAHFYVLLSGKVTASVIATGGCRQVLGQLKAGDTFGEAALMTRNPLIADFIADSPC